MAVLHLSDEGLSADTVLYTSTSYDKIGIYLL
jgi:hypothetical protein